MSNFKQLPTDEYDGTERWAREIDPLTLISVIYRLHGAGFWHYETAIIFVHPVEGRARKYKDADFLILDGDHREELDQMPKEQLREWYAAKTKEAQP